MCFKVQLTSWPFCGSLDPPAHQLGCDSSFVTRQTSHARKTSSRYPGKPIRGTHRISPILLGSFLCRHSSEVQSLPRCNLVQEANRFKRSSLPFRISSMNHSIPCLFRKRWQISYSDRPALCHYTWFPFQPELPEQQLKQHALVLV